jgi:glycosyltransferase involved in cell wall biosynthesis
MRRPFATLMAKSPLHFIVPGSIQTKTGGYGYDRRIVEGLPGLGRDVHLHELNGAFPMNDAVALSETAMIETVPDGGAVVIDGLALPAFAARIEHAASKCCIIPLIHHLLGDETSLSDAERKELGEIERHCLRYARHAIVTSPATAIAVAAAGVSADRISVVEPGVDHPPLAPRDYPENSTNSRGAGLLIISVGAVIARKGHLTLIRALAPLRNLDWRLQCFGSLTTDVDLSEALRQLIADEGLSDRVELRGEVDDAQLCDAYRRADIFALASSYEGYGMAFAEALTHGLPIIGSGDGAVCDTVPASAGILVSVGDAAAMSAALGDIMRDATLRETLSKGAKQAGAQLLNWDVAARRFDSAIEQAQSTFTATE